MLRGNCLELLGSMLEIVKPVLELLLVSWALGRDSNNSFLNPDTWDLQVLSSSFTSIGTLYMHRHIKFTLSQMPFFLYWTSPNFFACLCWLAPTLLAKNSAKLYAFQKEFVLASFNLIQSELKTQWLHLKGIQIMSFTLNLPCLIFFIPQPICPEPYTLLAFWFMQEYGEKEMDKRHCKLGRRQNMPVM